MRVIRSHPPRHGQTRRDQLLRELAAAGFSIKVSPTYGTIVYSPGPARAILGSVSDTGDWKPIRIPLNFPPLTAILSRHQ